LIPKNQQIIYLIDIILRNKRGKVKKKWVPNLNIKKVKTKLLSVSNCTTLNISYVLRNIINIKWKKDLFYKIVFNK